MKCTFLSIAALILSVSTIGQVKFPAKAGVRKNRELKPIAVAPVVSYDPVFIRREIDSLLNSVVEKYATMPNTATTWTSIKAESEDILFRYFRSGQLFGSKPEESFFVIMDASTMTANDVLNHKMILVAGLALYKPADFVVVRVEKKNVFVN